MISLTLLLSNKILFLELSYNLFFFTQSSSLTGNLTTSGNRLDQLSTEFRNEMQLPPSERTRLASEAADARDAVSFTLCLVSSLLRFV